MHVIIGISTQKVLEFYKFQTLSHHAISTFEIIWRVFPY